MEGIISQWCRCGFDRIYRMYTICTILAGVQDQGRFLICSGHEIESLNNNTTIHLTINADMPTY